jgi:hypothetical protein
MFIYKATILAGHGPLPSGCPVCHGTAFVLIRTKISPLRHIDIANIGSDDRLLFESGKVQEIYLVKMSVAFYYIHDTMALP